MQQLAPLAAAPRAAIVAPCANVATRHCRAPRAVAAALTSPRLLRTLTRPWPSSRKSRPHAGWGQAATAAAFFL